MFVSAGRHYYRQRACVDCSAVESQVPVSRPVAVINDLNRYLFDRAIVFRVRLVDEEVSA